MRHLLVSTPFALILSLTACSTATPDHTAPQPPRIHLTASRISPVDVELHWTDPNPHIAGHVVEYANDLTDNFISLAFLPPTETSFKHPNLIPQTHFVYRIRPYYGLPSTPVSVSLPSTLSDKEYTDRYATPEDYSWGPPQTLPEKIPTPKTLLRKNPTTATPTDLHALLMPITVSGLQLTWTDRSSDEDGILLEQKTPDAPDFQVAALCAPNTNSFGWSLAPPTRYATFRLRAFYYGAASNLVSVTTGCAPSSTTRPQ